MITLRQILTSQSSILENAKVKLVRHKDSRAEYREMMKDRSGILDYQSRQPKNVFEKCDYIVSFVGLERSRAVLLDAFKVNGYELQDGWYHYNLEKISDFSSLSDRVIIDWGRNAISWHQWYQDQPKEVIEILPHGYIGDFPGLLNFVLDFSDLKKLIESPNANNEWRHHLSAVNGVYLILDAKTGKQYIGSANGLNGIWQRWSEYVRSLSGGNKELQHLIDADPNYYKYFHFSVLQTLPSNITQREIVEIEGLYKQKLGSRAHGLNHN